MVQLHPADRELREHDVANRVADNFKGKGKALADPDRGRANEDAQTTLDLSSAAESTDESSVEWGSNFWVTIVDPLVCTFFVSLTDIYRAHMSAPSRKCRRRLSSSHVLRPAKPPGTHLWDTLCACPILSHQYNSNVCSAHVLVSMPPNEDGEWWEIQDESRGNMSYFYHTKTSATTWERPDGFVIPLGAIQVRPF